MVWKWQQSTSSLPYYAENVILSEELGHKTREAEEEENLQDSDNDTNAFEEETVHTVTFKCIGVTRERRYQNTLRIACERICDGYTVPVRLTPEPNNIYDSKAIVFECNIFDKWEKIGYIIKEFLKTVHAAMDCKEITSVAFFWIKYISDWRQSGPGYFTGINISKKGNWDKAVLKYCSTR